MRFGSCCSGIEAASVAWHPLGWQAAWLAEIEAFPSAVLAHHYPTVPNLGDMTTITRRILTGEVEAPDVFTGGTPCQAFSVAGLRRSLDDARGNLSLTFCEIVDAIDHVRVARGDQPSIIVWENVPGVLSTKDNAFGCFLAGLAGEDGELQPPGGRWANAGLVLGPARTVAWRTLDAQYFGVAQRRRRVWVVASARDGFDPAEVLFEWDRVRRDSAPSRQSGEGAAARAAEGAGVRRWPADVASTLNAAFGEKQGLKDQHALSGAPLFVPAQPVGVTVHGTDPTVQKVASYDDVAQCLRARTPGNIDNSSTTVVQQPIAFHPTQDPISSTDGTTHAMGCGSSGGQASVAVAVRETSPTITSNYGKQVDSSDTALGPNVVPLAMQVRRLTPIECERLQGFPDNYTRIPWKLGYWPADKHSPEVRAAVADQCPDGPRYKALGNSWAVPCARWIGARIVEVLS